MSGRWECTKQPLPGCAGCLPAGLHHPWWPSVSITPAWPSLTSMMAAPTSVKGLGGEYPDVHTDPLWQGRERPREVTTPAYSRPAGERQRQDSNPGTPEARAQALNAMPPDRCVRKSRRLCPRCKKWQELGQATCHPQGAGSLSSPTYSFSFKGLRAPSLLRSEFINTAELSL